MLPSALRGVRPAVPTVPAVPAVPAVVARPADVAVPAGLAAGLALEVATAVSGSAGPVTGTAGVLLALVACAGAVFRRRRPSLAAAVAVCACLAAEVIAWAADRTDQPAPVACLAVLIVVGTAVRRSPAGEAAAVAAAAAVVAAGTLVRYAPFLASGTQNAFTATRLMVAGWLVAVGAGLWWRWADHRRVSVLEAVRRDERFALARDLHDVAAHHLTGLVIQAQVAQLAAAHDPDATRTALAGIEAAGTEALTSLRDVVRLLRDEDDAAPVTPGPEPLADLVARFARTGRRATLQLPDGPLPGTWPASVTTTVYRIVQEALTNVARHASDALDVTVTVGHDRDAVRVTVTDDAPAPRVPRPAGSGHGIVGMRERAAVLGGSVEAGPGPDGGWCVRATLPTRPAP